MPRKGTPLTDTEIRQARAGDKPSFLYDTGGLYLELSPTGSKLWRLKYIFGGKEYRLSLGKYPVVSLKQARIERDKLHALIAQGINPSEQRKQAKQEQVQRGKTLEVVAQEWIETNREKWAPSNTVTIESRLKRDIFPTLGAIPIKDITPGQLLDTLRAVVARGTISTAKRELAICSQIWRYALACGYCPQDITYSLRGALPPEVRGHFGAITDPETLGKVLAMIDTYPGGAVVKVALWLCPRLFVRPGELRTMRWVDVDLSNREWRYVVPKTKQPHIVPLARQVVEKLEWIKAISGRVEWVFPGLRNMNKPLSNMALTAALHSMGIPGDMATAHGFRATARTLLDEVLGFRVDIIEHQLAHTVKDALGRAYNRTQFLKERHELMQNWADYLDELKEKYAVS